MNESDEALVTLYRDDGDEAAITELVQRYTTPLFSLLVRLVGDRQEAEDLTQEVFMKMWKHLSSFDVEKSFKTWVFTIARNSAIDYLRKKKLIMFSHLDKDDDEGGFAESIADSGPMPDEIFEQQEVKARIEELLSQLSVDERTIILLHKSDEMTFEEIAKVLERPMNSVKSRYRRALEKLRALV